MLALMGIQDNAKRQATAITKAMLAVILIYQTKMMVLSKS